MDTHRIWREGGSCLQGMLRFRSHEGVSREHCASAISSGRRNTTHLPVIVVAEAVGGVRAHRGQAVAVAVAVAEVDSESVKVGVREVSM